MNRLLLIDDEPNFAYMLTRALTRRGFAVTTAPTPIAARQAIRTAPPAYAIVDMKLGDESGLALIDPLRVANDAMRIVVLTGYASIATTVEAIKRGADNYLAKPLDIDALMRALLDVPTPAPRVPPRPMSLRRLEWEHIQRVLERHEGNISAAARTLGMHRRTLQRRLAKRPVRR